MELSNKTVEFRLYADDGDGKLERIEDVTEVKLPEVEKLSDKIKGAGILGEIDMPTLGLISSMDMEVSTRTANENYGILVNAQKIEVRWVTDKLDSSNCKVGVNAHKAFISVINKKISEGKIAQGDPEDGSITYEVIAYKRTINGKEILNIDKLNGIFAINGANQLSDIEKNL